MVPYALKSQFPALSFMQEELDLNRDDKIGMSC